MLFIGTIAGVVGEGRGSGVLLACCRKNDLVVVQAPVPSKRCSALGNSQEANTIGGVS
jgi:hypothetical protein